MQIKNEKIGRNRQKKMRGRKGAIFWIFFLFCTQETALKNRQLAISGLFLCFFAKNRRKKSRIDLELSKESATFASSK
jgi:hypothetical protein